MEEKMHQSKIKTAYLNSKEQQHIRSLFDTRGKNDPNSTTLANTLDKDIQTVFNSMEKFVFELLQNADDAGVEDHSIDMCFKLIGDHLIFFHNGKHFDEGDVEAICDNAQRRKRGKEIDIEKTGYKGIGFKSVFVITDCVSIFSKEYTFRFDRHFSKWQQETKVDYNARYPWQIIPIWTSPEEVPLATNIDREQVNFLFKIKKNIDIKQALFTIIQNPQMALFLRRTKSIVIDLEGELHSIRIERNSHIRSLYLDGVLQGRWLMSEKTLNVSNDVHQRLQEMGAHECPEKLKQAKQTRITFGAKLNAEGIIEVSHAPLFCYLPTTIDYNFPFLMNADFLLSADRTQLLKNDWNKYLLGEIGRLHIHWLKELAENHETRDRVLLLLKRKLFIESSFNLDGIDFNKTYVSQVEQALQEIPFIPSYQDPTVLFLFADAVSDDVDFFHNFPWIDPTVEKKLARYELVQRQMISQHFGLRELSEKLENYFCLDKSIAFQKKLLAFIKDKYRDVKVGASRTFGYSGYRKTDEYGLSRKKSILTKENKFVSPEELYLPTTEKLIIPSLLKLHFIHDELLSISGLSEWLIALGTKELVAEKLFDDVVSLRWDEDFNEQTSIEMFTFIYHAYQSGSISEYKLDDLKNMPLLTASNEFQDAKKCYLSSRLLPRFDLQKFVNGNGLFLSDRYLQEEMDAKQLGKIFKKIGVKDSVAFHHIPSLSESDHEEKSTIDHFQEYRSFLQTRDGVYFFGSRHQFRDFIYFDFLSCLSSNNYTVLFWKTIAKKEETILKYCANTQIIVRSNTRSEIFNATSYLVYFLSQISCIKGVDGKLYKASALYAPALLEKIGPRLSTFFPRMKTKFKNFELELTEKLARLFKFKNKISAQDCLNLLDFISQEKSQTTFFDYVTMLDIIFKQKFTEKEITQFQSSSIYLIAGDDTFKQSSSLYYYQGQTTLRDMRSEYFLKNLPNFDDAQMQRLCALFNVRSLRSQDMTIHPSGLQQNDALKNRIQNSLSFWALIEARHTKIDKETLIQKWLSWIDTLEILATTALTITYKTDHQASFQTRLFTLDNEIYYVNDGKRAEKTLLREIAKCLAISEKTLTDIMETFDYSNSDRQAWLKENGFHVDLLMQTQHQAGLVEPPYHDEKLEMELDEDDPFSNVELAKPDVKPNEVICSNVKFMTRQSPLFTSSPVSPSTQQQTHQVQQKIKSQNENLNSPRELSQRTTPGRHWTGRWGEEMVFNKLKTHYREKYSKCNFRKTTQGFILDGHDTEGRELVLEVIWCNKNEEQGKPFDLEIIKNDVHRYIEVKSTHHANQCSARVSRNEWASMRKEGDRYRLFCLYNAGKKDNIKITKIKNPAQQLFSGELKPYEIQFKL